ncbi:MAG: acyl-CoA thioesterase [Gemmatimonadetes bacterium]|nr:acyl-CoA thioesterase [Gemmatimonadota bacterium]
MSTASPSKTVAGSRVTLVHLMRPQHSNFANKVHGGTILSLMDEVAYVCASKYAEAYCVTVAVDQVEFLSPIKVGDIVRMEAAVNYAGSTSVEIGITITAEDPRRPDSTRHTNRSFITMVAVDEAGQPTSVPGLVCETAEDKRLCCEAQLRREYRRRFKQEIEAGVCRFEMRDEDSGV